MTEIKHKTVKFKLKDIFWKKTNYYPLLTAVKRTNEIIKIGSLFVNAFIIHCISTKYTKIKHLNHKVLRQIYKVLCSDDNKKTLGRPCLKIAVNEGETSIIDDVKKFFNENFTSKTGIKKLDATNLSYILGGSYESMYEEITNQILNHYEKMINKFVRVHNPKRQDENRKVYGKRISDMINHLMNGTFYERTLENNRDNCWLEHYRPIVLPPNFNIKTFEHTVNTSNFQYLVCIYNINEYLISRNIKSFKLLPIRSQTYDNYIKINTNALIETFYNKLKHLFPNTVITYYSKVGDPTFQEDIWNKIFKLKNQHGNYRYKFNGYSFNYELATDGYACSLNFIHKNDVIKKEAKKAAFRKGRVTSNAIRKCKSDIEKAELTKKKEETQLANKLAQKKLVAERLKQRRIDFKKLSKEEQEKELMKRNSNCEFPYIERYILSGKLNRDEIYNAYINGKLLVCDPGKRSILMLMGANNKKTKDMKINQFGISVHKDKKFMNYTSKTRRKFLRTKEYSVKRDQWKLKPNHYIPKNLKEVEKELSDYNGKSMKLEDFYEYVNKRIEYMNIVKSNYDTTYLQALKWKSYLNKQKHEKELVDQIANEFGEDIIIIIGDWSSKNCRLRFMPTPNLSLKRKLAQRFKVFSIDEYNTSKIHNKYHVECKNIKGDSEYDKYKKFIDSSLKPTRNICGYNRDLYKKSLKVLNNLRNKQSKNIKRKVHAVLTFQIDTSKMAFTDSFTVNGLSINKTQMAGCINRDKNSVYNMLTIVRSLLDHGRKPDIFIR
jgi:hypothetical protein